MSGSFAVEGQRIDVELDWSDIDGLVYRLIRADTRQQVAVTTYRGLEFTKGTPFPEASLQAGLDEVKRRSTRT